MVNRFNSDKPNLVAKLFKDYGLSVACNGLEDYLIKIKGIKALSFNLLQFKTATNIVKSEFDDDERLEQVRELAMPYEEFSVKTLKKLCQQRGLTGFWNEKKIKVIVRLKLADEQLNISTKLDEEEIILVGTGETVDLINDSL